MENVTSIRHVQVPNNMCRTGELEPLDVLVYANIRRFMNGTSRQAWPTMATIQACTGLGRDRVLSSIKKLDGKYLKVAFHGNKRYYVFPRSRKGFEPFSYDFLDNGELTSLEKAYILISQQFMFKDFKSFGKMTFQVADLSSLINMSEWNIRKCDRDLQSKGYLMIVPTQNRDFETGLPLTEKIFDLEGMGQGLIWQICGNLQKIQKNNEYLHKLEKELEMARRALRRKVKRARLDSAIVLKDGTLKLVMKN